MNPKFSSDFVKAVTAIHVAIIGVAAQAQFQTTLVEFTNRWAYDQSCVDLDEAWRQPDFNDSAWPSGGALLGFEEETPYPYSLPTRTLLLVGNPPIMTYYFRTKFHFDPTNFNPGLLLLAECLVDDGCVIYLNGVEAARLRVVTNQVPQMPSHQHGPFEGMKEVLSLATNSLVPGNNVLAAEVYQRNATSLDLIWGMKLLAWNPLPLLIVHQPQSQDVPLNSQVTLRVGVEGGPVAYQWYRDGTPLAGETHSLVTVTAASSNAYHVVVSNALGVATSAATVVRGRTDLPLQLLSVVPQPLTDRIVLTFSQRLSGSTAANPTNYTIRRINPTNSVNVSQAQVSLSMVRLILSGVLADDLTNHVVEVRNVMDIYGNQIAADTQIPIAHDRTITLIESNAVWRQHSNVIEDDRLEQFDWMNPSYQESQWWVDGVAPFFLWDTNAQCLGAALTPLVQDIRGPYLFRTTFLWNELQIREATLSLTRVTTDGSVYYLNGLEILRTNLPVFPTRLDRHVRATVTNVYPSCATDTVTVSNLVVGSNLLAVAVYRPPTLSGVYPPYTNPVLFGVTAKATARVAPAWPPDLPPLLAIQQAINNQLRLSWLGDGFTLESCTSLDGPSGSGVWQPISPSISPHFFTNRGEQLRLFRLKK